MADVLDLRVRGSRLQHDDHVIVVAGAFEAGSHRGWPEIGATRLRSPAPFRAVFLSALLARRSSAVLLTFAPERFTPERCLDDHDTRCRTRTRLLLEKRKAAGRARGLGVVGAAGFRSARGA